MGSITERLVQSTQRGVSKALGSAVRSRTGQAGGTGRLAGAGRVASAGRLAKTVRGGSKVVESVVRDRIAERGLDASFAPGPEDHFVAGVFFAGDQASLYQLEQWVWSFERLAERLRTETGNERPFGILCRSARAAEALAQLTELPVRFARLTAGMDWFMTQPDLRAVFYVNQSTLNFQGLRYPRPAHVHLSHGESEKISMISNQLKAYDAVFTAGPAARERIERALIGMPESHLYDVGRPQLDRPARVPAVWTDLAKVGAGSSAGAEAMGGADAPHESQRGSQSAGPVVFYAPTWEGDSPAMAYGTLPETGEAIVRALVDAGARVIYRPHPRTGVVQPRFAAADQAIRALVAQSPGSLVDTTHDVGWQFNVADACVAEMTSVAFDWLTTGRPLVLVRPSDPGAEVLPGGLFDRVPSVAAQYSDAASFVVETLLGEADAAQRGAAAEHYLGDTSAGAQQRRFEDAALAVIAQRDGELRERAQR